MDWSAYREPVGRGESGGGIEATSRRSRRSLLRLGGGALLATAWASCTTAPQAPTAVPAQAAAGAPAKTGGPSGTIELYFPRVKICRLCGAVDDWNTQNPNAKVVDKDIPWPYDKQVATLAAGEGGPDVYQDEPANILRDGLNGKLLDFTDVVESNKDNYLSYKVEQFRIPKTGKIYAVPWQVGITVEIYREDILKKLGMNEFPAGWTWDQHEDLAEKAKKDLNVSTNWIGPGKASDVQLFGQMLWQAGGSFVSKDWRTVELDSPVAIDVARRLKRWWTKGLLFEGSSYTPPLWGAMREGILWSTTDPSWWLLGMRDNITKPEDHVGDWRVAPMPVFQAGGARTANFGGAGLTAPAHTKNPDLVKAFVKYATTQQNATVATIKMGTLVAHKSAYTDAAVLDLTLEPTGPQKIYRVYAELSKEVPDTFHYSPGWPEMYDIVNQNLLTLLKSDTPVEVGMKKIADDARKANERWIKLLDQ